MKKLGLVVGILLLSTGTALAADSARVHGQQIFEKWCAPCHGRGPGKPGTIALQTKYQGKFPALLEERTDLTPDIVAYFVRHGVSIMPFFRKTEIADRDLSDLAAYLADDHALSK
jgi:mono/diheme cytochrome c family protein